MGSVRPKMSVENRAKQFMPFAALRGLPEALALKERIIVDKIELTEDMAAELDWKINMIDKGMIITVIYFSNNQYIQKTGMVSGIDKTARVLKVVDLKISFEDLLKIEI